MVPTKLYLCAGSGTHPAGDKNARDRASVACGLHDMNLVSVSSVLPAGIRLIDRAEFRGLVESGQIVHAIHGICESTVPGQRINATLCCVVPDDPAVVGYVAELYEHPGIGDDLARRRTEIMALQLFAERTGAGPDFRAESVWVPGRISYVLAGHPVRLVTVQGSAIVNPDGDYTAALAAAVLLP